MSDSNSDECWELIKQCLEHEECREYLFGTRPELKLTKPDWLLLSEQNLQLRFGLPFRNEDKPFGSNITFPNFWY